MKSLKLHQLIRIADKAYTDGKVREAYQRRVRPSPAELNSSACRPCGSRLAVGDGLATFIANELEETFDPKRPRSAQLVEAARAMSVAKRELETIVEALMEADLSSPRGRKEPAGMRCGRRNPN